MRKLFALTLFICCSLSVSSQSTGDYFMTHFTPEDQSADYTIFDLTTDVNGLLWISTNYGVFTYDGSEWDFFETPSAAVSLHVDESNMVYIGCVGEIGKIDYFDRKFGYQPIFQVDSVNDVFFDAEESAGQIHFLGSGTMVSINDGELSVKDGEFLNFYSDDQGLVINEVDTAYVRVSGKVMKDVLVPDVAFTFSKDDKRIYVQFDGTLLLNQKPLPHNKILRRNDIVASEGAFINDSLFVLGTLDKGAVFLNTKDTSYYKSVDYYSGLPDNEIYSLHVDNQNGVWLAHQFGLTRVLPLFPAYSYSNLPGLSGNLLNSAIVDGRLWIASSVGVFYYNQDTTYKTKVYYDVKQPPKPKKRPQTPVVKEKPEKDDDSGFLGGLFKKKDRAKENTAKGKVKGFFKTLSNDLEDIFAAGGEIDRIVGKKKEDVQYIRREEKIPVKVNYEFVKVPGANGKFQEIFQFKDLILGVGNTGIYELSENSSSQVVDEAIRKVIVTKDEKIVIYTYSEELVLFELDENVWVELWRRNVSDPLLNLYNDEENKLWLSGSERLYRASFTDSTLNVERTFSIKNEFFDKIEVLEGEDHLWFVNSNGIFYLDTEQNEFVKDKEKTNKIVKSVSQLKDNSGNIWIYNGKTWFRFGENAELSQFEYLSLFPEIRSLSIDPDKNFYWIITEDNRLLSYDIQEAITLENQHQLFVKKVESTSGSYGSKSKFTLNYDENFLSVNLSQPDYTGLLKPVYKYKLEGLNSEWSDWTNNNIIDFSYLPPGNYDLKVRTKDNFGRQNEYELLEFNVKTPYWQQPWFYALQVIFFGGLVVVSSRLNQSNTSNRLLSEGLTILTIILVIEFLQSVISSYFTFQSSPVVDFGLDAMVALCIFPLERFLRIFIKKGGPKVNVNKFNLGKNKGSD